MNLHDVTPTILTYNEERNIGRTVDRLGWANEVVVVDSFSADETMQILGTTDNVRAIQREFTNHAEQWNYAVHRTGIDTEWVLALDADYVLTDEFIEELKNLTPGPDVNGYQVAFRYCINGKPLRGSLYPPVIGLFRRERARYDQDGHTQRLRVEGGVGEFKARIHHDDRKDFSIWLQSQDRYMKLEAGKLLKTPMGDLGMADKLRLAIIPAPVAVFLYCLFWKRLILDGRAGLYYTLQRVLAEMMLSTRIVEAKLAE